MQMLRKHAVRVIPALAVLLIATGFIVGGALLSGQEPAQVNDYNRAMTAYRAMDIDKALGYLDQSLSDYDEAKASSPLDRALHGRPNDELAAQAHFHKGVLLLMKAQAEKRPGLIGQAVEELETSLTINPGSPYRDNVSPGAAARLNQEALVVKHDLDLLFQKHPEQQQNGKGKPQGPPKPAQPGPGDNPGDKPGHGNDDGI